jgi:DNA-binding transcriptional ArsR family regulator
VANQFPQDIYQQLDGIDFRLLDELAFLCRKQRQRTGAAYCCPGREYLARKVDCDIGTISRHTTKLERLGLIEKIQRRPVRGQWRSCLYRLRSWVSWRLGQIAGMLRKVGKARSTEKNSHRVRPDARIAHAYENSAPRPHSTPLKPPLTAQEIATRHPILQRWLQRGKF